MSEQEYLFGKVETLLPLLTEYRKSGSASINHQQTATLKEVITEILGRGLYDFSCSTCVLNYMLTVESWYHREKKKVETHGNDYAGVELITADTPMDTSIAINPYGEDYRVQQADQPKNKRSRKKKTDDR